MTTLSMGLGHPMLAQLAGEWLRIEPRTRVAVTGLPESRFLEVPPDGGWSVAQVFEHLCVSNESYLSGPLPAAVAAAERRGPWTGEWRPSLVGGWLTRTLMEGARPVPSPRAYRVGPKCRPNVVDEYLGTVRRLGEWMKRADGHDLRVGLASPVSPLIRMNLGDAFRILVVHSHRHLAQVERTRRAVGM
jgi:hypothetical protein